MLPVCYDPYAGTLGRFARPEIFELVAKAGYDGINVPVNRAFLGELSSGEIDDAKKLAEKYNLVVPTVGFGLGVAKRLNAEVIGIWPNPPKNASRQEALDTLADNLSKMLPALDAHGMKIALEFEKGCPLDNYREGIAFI
ncbi:hypothetical protein HYR99_11100, partial [Candidatus Poribacteria bacterium]|nr:hypothetical protein [Candidatus Poribacteria bacterium]